MSHPSSWTQLNPTLIGAAGVPNFFIRKVSTVRNKVPQPLHFVRHCDDRKVSGQKSRFQSPVKSGDERSFLFSRAKFVEKKVPKFV